MDYLVWLGIVGVAIAPGSIFWQMGTNALRDAVVDPSSAVAAACTHDSTTGRPVA